MRKNIWRLAAFVATLALIAMVFSKLPSASREEIRQLRELFLAETGQAEAPSGGGEAGSTTTANKNQPKPKEPER